MRMIAITRGVSPRINECELTHQERVSIDVELARQQHAAYEATLRELGVTVESQPALEAFPDSVFIEDTAIVLEQVAVITRPGVASRRGETEHTARVLQHHRELVYIEEPGTLEGGDVVRLGDRILVGLSQRTNREGVIQLAALVGPYGYTVEIVPVKGALHLKSACACLAHDLVIANPEWVELDLLGPARVLEVNPQEPGAANVLNVHETVMVSDVYPETRAVLEKAGFRTRVVGVSELHKAEAGLTCMSLLFGIR
jgi:dimethylargininase